jgi:hypothetical protein
LPISLFLQALLGLSYLRAAKRPRDGCVGIG